MQVSEHVSHVNVILSQQIKWIIITGRVLWLQVLNEDKGDLFMRKSNIDTSALEIVFICSLWCSNVIGCFISCFVQPVNVFRVIRLGQKCVKNLFG